MSEHDQVTYNRASYSNPATTVFHGTPPCPACEKGVLRLWDIGMAFDDSGHPFVYDKTPPAKPEWRYQARVMICRGRYTDAPGCGFTLPVHGVTTGQMPRGPE
jgi:hypothetical protein